MLLVLLVSDQTIISVKELTPLLSSVSFTASGLMFKSFIHLELIVMCGVKQGFNPFFSM